MSRRIAALAEPWRRVLREPRASLTAAVIAALATLALLKLGHELDCIFRNPETAGDLRYFYDCGQAWWDGLDVYRLPNEQPYPPATLPLFYLAFSRLDWWSARYFSGVAGLCGIAFLVCVAIRGTRARSWSEIALAMLLVLSNAGPSTALGNGQTNGFVLPCVFAAVFLVQRWPQSRWRDHFAAALILIALMKPHLSAPFLWLTFVLPSELRWRPLGLALAGYAALTAFAVAMFPHPGLDTLLDPFRIALEVMPGSFDANLQYVLYRLHLRSLVMPVAGLAFLLLGAWIVRHRRRDLWLLLAMTALVARLSTYHRFYDDTLLLLPEVMLWRIASVYGDADDLGLTAKTLLILNALVVLATGPWGRPLWLEPIAFISQGSVWAATLLFLAWYAERSEF